MLRAGTLLLSRRRRGFVSTSRKRARSVSTVAAAVEASSTQVVSHHHSESLHHYYPAHVQALVATLSQQLVVVSPHQIPSSTTSVIRTTSHHPKEEEESACRRRRRPLGVEVARLNQQHSQHLYSQQQSATSSAWTNMLMDRHVDPEHPDNNDATPPWLQYFEHLGLRGRRDNDVVSRITLPNNKYEDDEGTLLSDILPLDRQPFNLMKNILNESNQNEDDSPSTRTSDLMLVSSSRAWNNEVEGITMPTEATTVSKDCAGNADDSVLVDLERAMQRNDSRQVVREFKKLEERDQVQLIPTSLLEKLLFQISYRPGPPFVAHRVLKYYQQRQEEDLNIPATERMDSMVNWYKNICYNLRCLDPHKQYNHDIQHLVRSVVADVQHLSDDNKKLVFPILVTSLVEQRAVRVGQFARPIFQQLLTLMGPGGLDGAYLEHLLGHARFQRHEDLPYAEILQMLVAKRRPNPAHAVSILQNLFPFDNLNDTTIALKALVDLQTSRTSSAAADNAVAINDPREAKRQEYQYIVDLNTLELIGASATRKENLELSLLVWDAVHAMGYRAPSVGIYENLVLMFCTHPQHYGSAFTVLAEMDDREYVVSRALIRSMSMYLRESPRNLDIAMTELKSLRQRGLHVTAAMLNAILSGGSERGDIDRSLSVLDEFSRNNVQPDADSYSYVLEAIGKHLSRRTRTPASAGVENYCLETAGELLTRMEEQGVAPSHHVIREYVELLCRTGQVEVATEVVFDSMALPSGDTEDGAMPLVNDKAIYRVAMANAKQKKFEVARRVAACSSEPLPFLWRTIEYYELREQNRELREPFVDNYNER